MRLYRFNSKGYCKYDEDTDTRDTGARIKDGRTYYGSLGSSGAALVDGRALDFMRAWPGDISRTSGPVRDDFAIGPKRAFEGITRGPVGRALQHWVCRHETGLRTL